MRLAICAVVLTLVTGVLGAPAGLAMEQPAKPTAPTSTGYPKRGITGIGVATDLKPGIDLAWVHFQPIVHEVDHLVVHHYNDLATICYIDYGGRRWNLIHAHDLTSAGYTWESSLTVGSPQWCGNVGVGTDGPAVSSWVHLYPQADWAYRVIAPYGGPVKHVAAICTLGNRYDPSTGTIEEWHLFLDHRTHVAGFTYYRYILNHYIVPYCD